MQVLWEKILMGGFVEFLILAITPFLFLTGLINIFTPEPNDNGIFFLGLALIPLLLGFIGTFLGYQNINTTLASISTPPPPAELEDAYNQAWFTTYTGLAITVPLFLMGLVSLIVTKKVPKDLPLQKEKD